jgi:hypothetical protein
MTEDAQVLKPFIRAEARTTAEAAAVAGKTVRTVRLWCEQHAIGRRLGSAWMVSIVALDLYLSGETKGLAAYLRGDRAHPLIVAAYARHGVPLPKQNGNGDLPLKRKVATLVSGQ